MEMDLEEEEQSEFIFPSKDMSVLEEQKKKVLRERARLKRTSMGYDSNSDTDISISSKTKDEPTYCEVVQSGRSETSIVSNSSAYSRKSVSRRTPNVVATDHRTWSGRSLNLHPSELRKLKVGADGDRYRQSPSFHALERKLSQYSDDLPMRPTSSHEFHRGDNSMNCEVEDRPSTARSHSRRYEFSSSECTPRVSKSGQISPRTVSSFTSINTVIPEEDCTLILEEDMISEENPELSDENSTISETGSVIIVEDIVEEYSQTFEDDTVTEEVYTEVSEGNDTIINDDEESMALEEDDSGEENYVHENIGKHKSGVIVNESGDSDLLDISAGAVVEVVEKKDSQNDSSTTSTDSNTESEKLPVPEIDESLSQENGAERRSSEKSDSSDDGIQVRPQTVKKETNPKLKYPSQADYGIRSSASERTVISRQSYGAKVNNSQDNQKVDKATYDAILKMFIVPEGQNYDEYYNECPSFTKSVLDNKASITDKFYNMKANEDDVTYSLAPNHIIDNLELFALHPVPPGFIVKCRITRNRRGIDKNFFPIYYLHLERDDGRKNLLMVARKRKKSTTSNYTITTDPSNLSKESDAVVGGCRSNLIGTTFSVFDGLMSYKNFNFHERIFTNSAVLTQYREELAIVLYETNILGFKGPRKMDIVIPKMISASARMEIRPERKQDTILEKVKRNEMEHLHMLKNKTPIWNTDNQSFVLNFHGRVTHASVKNFQLVTKDSDGYCGLQFGRVAQDVFHLDFGYPMCPLQAFAIVLSSFDSKLACE